MSQNRISASAAGAFAALFALAGCASGPARNKVPEIDAGAAFQTGQSSGVVAPDWWRGFNDSELARLVDAAVRNNPALDGADFSVIEAEALLRLAGLNRQPSLNLSADASAARAPGDNVDVISGADATLAASWEWDAAGRLKALQRSALADVTAARETQRDLAVSLAAATALAYVDLRENEARLAVARRNADVQADSVKLARALFENGRSTQLDLDRAEAQYRTTLASLPTFEASRDAAQFSLAALTGTTPSAARSIAPGRVPRLAAPLITGAPEDLIRRRADVRLAEADLASLLALSDAARADLFPRVTFNANILALVTDRASLVSNDGFGFSLGPAISWQGPDLRRVRARVDAADARVGRAASNYESTVLGALSETESALTAYAGEVRRTNDLTLAANAARRARDLAELRYRQGFDSFLDVLDAQRTLNEAEDRLVVNEATQARRAIQIYRALGGIWDYNELKTYRSVAGSRP